MQVNKRLPRMQVNKRKGRISSRRTRRKFPCCFLTLIGLVFAQQMFWSMQLMLSPHQHISLSSSPQQDIIDTSTIFVRKATTPAIANNTTTTVHVLYGLQGNTTAFLDEWEVSLKSILMNAPIDAHLHVHIVTNAVAHVAVAQRLQQAQLDGSIWRHLITITNYNVEQHAVAWTELIQQAIRQGNVLDERVTLGGYYRLLASKILSREIGPVFYLDTDALVLANLNDLWRHVDDRYLFQWSARWPCSGAMILNMHQFEDTFWNLLASLPTIPHGGDQSLLLAVANAYPELVGHLPAEWDTHLGHGWRRAPHQLVQYQQGIFGMLHFNGARPRNERYWQHGLDVYCNRTMECHNAAQLAQLRYEYWQQQPGMLQRFVDYYVKLTWPMVKYWGGTSRLAPFHATDDKDDEKQKKKKEQQELALRFQAVGKQARDDFAKSWGMADFYIGLTWSMVKYLSGASQLPSTPDPRLGYALRVQSFEA